MPEGIKKYFLVTKPGIIFGNLISTTGGFFLASQGRVEGGVFLATLAGMSLVLASGCVLNNCFDRRLDRKMERTHDRALAQGLMSPGAAVLFAALLGGGGLGLLGVATNALCVAVVLTGFAIYVVVYTLYLKRQSVYATLIGSLAGAAPPLAGYCAGSNRFDLGAVILLSIFSLWQMPHSYAIAIFRFKDYAAAALPVLPVRQGTPAVKKQITLYLLGFVGAASMLTFSGYTGYRYFAAVGAMGVSWLYMSWSGNRTPDDRIWAKKMFIFSILTMAVLSLMMSIDFAGPASSPMLLTWVR
jgi:protoheme IX farnesyltransferase